jgi:hypothetical protein
MTNPMSTMKKKAPKTIPVMAIHLPVRMPSLVRDSPTAPKIIARTLNPVSPRMKAAREKPSNGASYCGVTPGT